MRQPYRSDVTAALNIVKFWTRFASNKRQLQRRSTILRVNALAALGRLENRIGALNPGIGSEDTYSQRAVGKSETLSS